MGKQFKIYGSVNAPLFLAKDVAEWIEHSDVSTMLRSIDEEEKLTQTLFVSGQNRDMWLLTENGLYEVLFQSRKPIAKAFKKEVKMILKQIRLTGGAVIENREAEFIDIYFPKFNDNTKLAMVQDLREQNENFRNQIEQQSNQLEEQQPLVEFTKKVAATADLIDVGKMSKLLHDENVDIGRNKLFHWLRKKKIFMQNNIPYQQYINGKYFVIKESVKETPYGTKIYQTTYVTGKGQIYITKKIRNEFLQSTE